MQANIIEKRIYFS